MVLRPPFVQRRITLIPKMPNSRRRDGPRAPTTLFRSHIMDDVPPALALSNKQRQPVTVTPSLGCPAAGPATMHKPKSSQGAAPPSSEGVAGPPVQGGNRSRNLPRFSRARARAALALSAIFLTSTINLASATPQQPSQPREGKELVSQSGTSGNVPGSFQAGAAQSVHAPGLEGAEKPAAYVAEAASFKSATSRDKGVTFKRLGKLAQNWMILWACWYAYVVAMTSKVWDICRYMVRTASSVFNGERASTAKTAWSG